MPIQHKNNGCMLTRNILNHAEKGGHIVFRNIIPVKFTASMA